MTVKVLKIHPNDNVAVAIENLSAKTSIMWEGNELKVRSDIPAGHKIALTAILNNEKVIKYGFPIGRASKDICAGDWIHSQNLVTALEGTREYIYSPLLSEATHTSDRTFRGYTRTNGEVGIRNEIWIINTVSCVNKTAAIIAAEANRIHTGRLEGIYSFPHPFGCSQLGEDLLNTQKILAGLVNHPNAGGVLILGLGCENNHIGLFKELIGEYDERRVRFLNAQDVKDEVTEGVKLVGELVDYACGFQREEVSLSKIKVGLKCGGSDAFSGITANPLVGRCADILAGCGATVILTEVPEMFGAESILMERCINRDIFTRTATMVNSFKEYFTSYGQQVYENPSPGNKEGGITTLEEKSLGCIQKGGTANVTSVLDYGQLSRTEGLNLLYGPGNDLVASTALVASGVQLILFTTGRGTPLGAPVPTIKISSTNELYQRKDNWMDFDAGRILLGESIHELSRELMDYIVQAAGGTIRTRNELNDYREIGIFKDGVCL